MGKKKKFENAKTVRTLLAGHALLIEKYVTFTELHFLELNNIKDREVLLEGAKKIKKVCEDAIEELTT